jgi:hypothetical protein
MRRERAWQNSVFDISKCQRSMFEPFRASSFKLTSRLVQASSRVPKGFFTRLRKLQNLNILLDSGKSRLLQFRDLGVYYADTCIYYYSYGGDNVALG